MDFLEDLPRVTPGRPKQGLTDIQISRAEFWKRFKETEALQSSRGCPTCLGHGIVEGKPCPECRKEEV